MDAYVVEKERHIAMLRLALEVASEPSGGQSEGAAER